MNEHQPNSAAARHREEVSNLERLAALSSDPEVLRRWEDGVRLHRHAFLAYLTLGDPEIYEPDVLTSFENAFMATLDNFDAVIDDYLEGMDWSGPLDRLRAEFMIPEEALDWNRTVILAVIRELSRLVEEGGKVHVFNL